MTSLPRGCRIRAAESPTASPASICWRLTSLAGRVKEIAVHFGGVTASTEVIAVKRHTGAHASVIACKNTIANQNLAYAA